MSLELTRLIIVLVAALTSAAAVSAPTAAQDRWPVSFEANLGLGTGLTTGEYIDNNVGITADLLLGLRIRPVASGGLVAALTAALQVAGLYATICTFTPSGGCVQSFPSFQLLSAGVGWETRNETLRIMTGPAMVAEMEDDAWLAGWTGRVDVFGTIVGAASVRGAVLPSYAGDSFGLFAFGFGLRIR